MKVNKFYKTLSIDLNNKNILKFSRCIVDKDLIEEWKNENKYVKFIFLSEEYSDLTFDNSIHEIHAFKSKYKGNSNIKIPLRIVKKDKYISNIEICDEKECNGYVLISKLDLIGIDKTMKRKTKEERKEFAEKLCKDKLYEYNSILLGNVFHAKETDKDNNVVFEKIFFGLGDIDKHLKPLGQYLCTHLSTYNQYIPPKNK